MSYTDLCTYEDLKQADDSRAVVDDLDNLQTEAGDVITDVTALVESALGHEGTSGRGTIVRENVQALRETDWMRSDFDAGVIVAWADQKPVVEMNLDADDIADVKVARHEDGKLEYDGDPKRGTVTYFGGYRRPDQVLSNPGSGETKLPTGSGEALEGLSTLPPVLPRQLRMAAINISLHVLQNRAEGNLGRRVQQSYGQQQVTIEGADPKYIEKQLRRLQSAPHRRVLI